VIGPARGDVKWQANTEQGIDASQFLIDWEHQQAICPEGQRSSSWTPAIDNRTNEVITIKFSSTDCGRCPSQVHCIRSEKKYKRRTITIRPQAQHEALQAARRRQKTPAFAKQYALREGIEATISEASARLWHAPLPLYRPCQNALATSWDCRCDESGACGGMA
jgi:transposase